MTVVYTTSTTIQLSWTSSGPEVDGNEVMWKIDTTVECFENYTPSAHTTGSPIFTIAGLEAGSSYVITVVETNAAGRAVSDRTRVTATTNETGEVINGS